MRILLVEDENSLRKVVQRRLEQESYSVDSTGNGLDAIDYINAGEYDCILLDLMLPGANGLEILKHIRNQHLTVPVLLLTAKDSIQDRVTGLDTGADDYLTKPFSLDELSARVRALLRRGKEDKSPDLQVADLRIDVAARRVFRGETEIELTSKEYALLEYMMRNIGQVLTREQFIEHVWNFEYEYDSNIVDVYMRYLRRKIDAPFEQKLIQTVRGHGYILRAVEENT